MKHSLFVMSLLTTLAFGLTACDEGEFNDLKCDAATYESKCIDGNHYMWCQEGALVVTACDSVSFCTEGTQGAACVKSK